MPINASQTFFVDKGAVQNAPDIYVTSVNLYFRARPNEINNGSGIVAPGVTIRLVPTANGVPVLDTYDEAPWARAEYAEIIPTLDASQPTNFRFPSPVPVLTNNDYGIVIDFDGDEDFVLWTAKQGDYLLGTTSASGPSGQNYGKYFTKVTGSTAVASNAASSGLMASAGQTISSTLTPNSAYTQINWRPLNNVQLKFDVYAARFSVNGNTTFDDDLATYSPSQGGIRRVGGVWEYRLPSLPMEYVLYDKRRSSLGTIHAGEAVYQNTVYYSHYQNSTPTTASVVNGSSVVVGPASLDWNQLYPLSPSNPQYIVITSENHSGAGLDAVAVRKIQGIWPANNILVLQEPVPFTNASAKFFKSPVAFIDTVDTVQHYGAVRDILTLAGSNANSTVRFVNNTILAVNVTAAGSGYTNNDVLTIRGFENVASYVAGGYAAVGNVVTNPSGNIISIALANVGAGFVNTAQTTYLVTNSTGGTVSGGATFTVNVGAVLKAELLGTDGLGGRFVNCAITNLNFGAVTPRVVVTNPAGTVYTAHHRFGYYETVANTASGRAYFAYPDPSTTETAIVDGIRRRIAGDNPPTLPSRSNEFYILYPNGSPSMATANSLNQLPIDTGASNSSVIIIRTGSNNDFSHVRTTSYSTKLTFSKYIYNNDYTDENTNYGNAWAKEVTTQVNLAGNGAIAEDLVVYVTAHRPANTDIQVFAKIHNSVDGESFDSKDWTRLEYKGPAIYTSPTNEDDFAEYTFGFQAAPNTGNVLAGSVTLTLSSNAITGFGTQLSTDLAAGDMVKIYQPLFPNNYMISVVGTATTGTSATLVEPVANAGMVGSGLTIEKINYKKQAFSNKLNQNVCRYYTSSMAAVDGFDSMQFKVVLLSSNNSIYPIVDDIKAVAVSA